MYERECNELSEQQGYSLVNVKHDLDVLQQSSILNKLDVVAPTVQSSIVNAHHGKAVY